MESFVVLVFNFLLMFGFISLISAYFDSFYRYSTMTRVIGITGKGQLTIPKDLRDKFGFIDKAIVVETEDGIFFKPLSSLDTEMFS